MFFVSIFGPDGVGKSTHAKILANDLRIRGYKVGIVWIKSCHTLAYVLSRLYKKIDSRNVELNAYGMIVRIYPLCSNRLNRFLWALIEFVSLLPWIILKVYLPLTIMKKFVISDRYLIDSVVTIAYMINDTTFDSSYIAKLMLSLIPRNSALIYLIADYNTILKRRGKMAESKEFYYFQKRMYDRLSKRLGAIKIETTNRDILETAKVIREIVYNLMLTKK